MEQLLDRAAIRSLFEVLAGRLQRRGVRANLYVFGGAAIAMLFDERRVTRDIDGVILHGHGPLIEEVRILARERSLPSTWLNEQAAAYVTRTEDSGRSIVFDHPNLSVAAASAEHLLAMKLVAAAGPTLPTSASCCVTSVSSTQTRQNESSVRCFRSGP